MPISPADFFSVAESLRAGKLVTAGEPCDRTSVGRAYYAAYLALRDAVRIAYKSPKADIEHRVLRNGLVKAADPDVADIGLRLKQLWEARRRSDYEPSASLSPAIAALMLANAKHILAEAPRLAKKIPLGLAIN